MHTPFILKPFQENLKVLELLHLYQTTKAINKYDHTIPNTCFNQNKIINLIRILNLTIKFSQY